MSSFYRIDGWPVARGTARAFLTRLKPAFEKAFPGITLHVNSGFRSYEDQKKIFLERYRVQWSGGGPYGDVRWWNGKRYVRHSGKGTVAQPGTSNHGTGAAIDVYDSGKDAGVTVFGSARDKWMQANASKYGFSNSEGNAVNEAWHKNATVSAWEGAPIPREISPSDPGMTLDQLLGKTKPTNTPEPAPEPEEEDDDMCKPTVHVRTEGTTEWTLGHPEIGKNLPVFTGTTTTANSRLSADKKVKTFRGFMVTTDREIGAAWARTHAKGVGNETSRTDRDSYVAIQKELSRVSDELAGRG